MVLGLLPALSSDPSAESCSQCPCEPRGRHRTGGVHGRRHPGRDLPRRGLGARARASSRLAGCRAGPSRPVVARRGRVSGARRRDVRGLDRRRLPRQTESSSGDCGSPRRPRSPGSRSASPGLGPRPPCPVGRRAPGRGAGADSRARGPARRSRRDRRRSASSCSPTRSRTLTGWSTSTGARSSSRSRAGGRRSCGTGTTVARARARARPARRRAARRRGRGGGAAGARERAPAGRGRARDSRICARSRARIVAAGDAERKRLERDLHDGAQQRLVALALSLRLLALDPAAADRSPGSSEAEAELAGGASTSCASSPTASSRRCSPTRARGRSRRARRGRADAAPVGGVPAERFEAPGRDRRVHRRRGDGRAAKRGPLRVSAERSDGTLVVELDVRSGARRPRRRRARGPVWARSTAALAVERGRRADEDPRGAAVRVVIADDETLLREGLARLLADAGIEVVGTVGTAEELLRRVELDRARRRDRRHPDAADPHRRGARRRAGRSGARIPTVGVLVLSHYLESALRDAAARGALRALGLPAEGARLRRRRAGRRACTASPTASASSTRRSSRASSSGRARRARSTS